MNRDTIDIRGRLRAGDPARDAALDAVEVAALRRRLEQTLAEAPAAGLPWRALWAAAGLTALALALGMRATQVVPPAGERAATAPSPYPLKDQQLQFETADGVRIVWVLSPNVSL